MLAKLHKLVMWFVIIIASTLFMNASVSFSHEKHHAETVEIYNISVFKDVSSQSVISKQTQVVHLSKLDVMSFGRFDKIIDCNSLQSCCKSGCVMSAITNTFDLNLNRFSITAIFFIGVNLPLGWNQDGDIRPPKLV
jgi:hypothetical protein